MNHSLCLLRVLGQSFSLSVQPIQGIIAGNITENALISIVILRIEQKG